MKKPFFKTVVGRILKGLGLFALKSIILNQKGIKNTKNEDAVNDVFKNIP